MVDLGPLPTLNSQIEQLTHVWSYPLFKSTTFVMTTMFTDDLDQKMVQKWALAALRELILFVSLVKMKTP